MPRQRQSLADVTAALDDVNAAIEAMFPPQSRWLDLLDDGFTSADALDICAREAHARPHDHAELDRLRKLRDKLMSKRQRMTRS